MSVIKLYECFKVKNEFWKKKNIEELEKMILINNEIDICESMESYLAIKDKPNFNEWVDNWKRYGKKSVKHNDIRCVYIFNKMLNTMETALQFHQLQNIKKNNPDYPKILELEIKRQERYNQIMNHEDLTKSLTFFVIEKSGKIKVNQQYESQFLDCISEKINERYKPDQSKFVNSVGIENIISVWVSDYYDDFANWKKSMSDCLEYKLSEIVDYANDSRNNCFDNMIITLKKMEAI